jgi:hypothetical protein
VSAPVAIEALPHRILLAFRRLSDQEALDRVKRRLQAGVYEIRLFKDDLPTIFAAQLGVLRETLRYFRLSLVPMLWLSVPIVALVVQLQFRYGYEGLEPGQSALVEVQVTPEAASGLAQTGPVLALHAPEGVRIETPPVWVPSLREAGWRVAAERPGDFELVLRVGEQAVTKTLRVSGSVVSRSPVRPSGPLAQLLNPAEAPLPHGSAIEAVRVGYTEADVSLLGWETHWIAFFVLTMVFAFALAKRLGVKI